LIKTEGSFLWHLYLLELQVIAVNYSKICVWLVC
jgi:hypothetical protein